MARKFGGVIISSSVTNTDVAQPQQGSINILKPMPINTPDPKSKTPFGWFVGLGVLLITLGVVFGLVGIFIVARNKQKYRIPTRERPITTNATPHALSDKQFSTIVLLLSVHSSARSGWQSR